MSPQIQETQVDDSLDEYEAGRRKRRWIGLAVTAAALVLLGGAWAWWRATGLPPIPSEAQKSVREAMDSLSTVPRQYHAELAAAAMAELERGRLPDAMVDAFEKASSVPPEYAGLIMIQPFAEDPDSLEAWTVACPAGAGAIAEYASTNDIDKLFADCSLGRWSLIDGTEARRKSAGRLILAHAAWGWLVAHHSETDLERRVLRVFVQG